jgi:anti-sigma B factor antagonist
MHNDDPLSMERKEGKANGIQIIRVTGPLTLSNLFAFQDELRNSDLPSVSILELSGVPYMDSAGIGAVINYFTHSRNRGSRLVVTGVNSRVMELFKLTGVHVVIPMAATVEEAEGRL